MYQPWNDGKSFEPEQKQDLLDFRCGMFRSYAAPLVLIGGALLAVGLFFLA
jgi:hypothetical protein